KATSEALRNKGLEEDELERLQGLLMIQAWVPGDKRPALDWFIDAILCDPKNVTNPALHHRVVRIDNQEVLDLLGLPARSGYRYSIAEFAGRLEELQNKASEAGQVTANRRTVYQQKVIETAGHVQTLIHVINYLNPQRSRNDPEPPKLVATADG